MSIDFSDFPEKKDDISANLQDLKDDILKNKQPTFDKEDIGIEDYEYIKNDGALLETINEWKIPAYIVNKFIEKYKEFFPWCNKIPRSNYDYDDITSSKLKKYLLWEIQTDWPNILDRNISNSELLYLFYLKEISNNNFNKIFNMISDFFFNFYKYEASVSIMVSSSNDREIWYKLIDMIKEYWDNICDYFSFCNRKNWNYKNLSEFINDDKEKKTFEDISHSMTFCEIFVNEPESINLYNFLKENPVVLNNLWWKIIDNIDLDTKNWINFCFRWILEMIKSRPDIEFPHLNKDPSEKDKQEWEDSRKKIINEYEEMLRNYISNDFIENNNWEKIQKPKNETFDKIFYSRPYWDDVLDIYHTNESTLRELTQNKVSEYSFKVDQKTDEGAKNEEAESVSKKLLSDIESYVKNHPNEKILICIDQHGNPDWSSWNWWEKEDWIKLANLSPNIKIWSIRCFFWEAFDNNDIYKHKSSVSWFSNHTRTGGYIANIINEAWNLWLWFHEMEIYTRLNYPISVSPLTESMEYTNWNTWKTEIWKIGLAQNDKWQGENFNNKYA